MFRTRVELPVDESDITQLVEKIKIGFPVMVVPRNLKRLKIKKFWSYLILATKMLGKKKKGSKKEKKGSEKIEAS